MKQVYLHLQCDDEVVSTINKALKTKIKLLESASQAQARTRYNCAKDEGFAQEIQVLQKRLEAIWLDEKRQLVALTGEEVKILIAAIV